MKTIQFTTSFWKDHDVSSKREDSKFETPGIVQDAEQESSRRPCTVFRGIECDRNPQSEQARMTEGDVLVHRGIAYRKGPAAPVRTFTVERHHLVFRGVAYEKDIVKGVIEANKPS
jgi:hypothetical protein